MKRGNQISMSMTSVESLDRDQGGYKYLYCELRYMHQNILKNILEPFRTFQNFLDVWRVYLDQVHRLQLYVDQVHLIQCSYKDG